MIEGLNISETLLVAFSGVVAASTLVYALLTWRLVTETRRMRQVQTEPKVSMFVDLNEQIVSGIDLVIRNVGQGPAFNIDFSFKGDPEVFDENHPLDQLPLIKNGLNYLAPNQTFRFLLGPLVAQHYERAMRDVWTFDVAYEDQNKRSYRDTYVVDFSQFSQLRVESRAPLYQIEKHLEALQRDVRRLTTGSSKVRVVTQTKDEVRKEMEESHSAKVSQDEPKDSKLYENR